jgi:tetratricopeptide (TPR) repeat protein
VPKYGIDRLDRLRKADNKASAMDKLVLFSELRKFYNYAEEYEKAAESLETGIDAAENKISRDDLILIGVKNNPAYAYEQKGEHKKCIALPEEVLPTEQEILGKAHFDTLKILVYLIEQYSKIKGLTKAISLLEELVPIQRKTLGQVHKKTMSSKNDLAELYHETRNVYTALKHKHMVSMRQKNLGPGDEERKWAEVRYQKCIET